MNGSSVFRQKLEERALEQVNLHPASTVGVVVKGSQVRQKVLDDPWIKSTWSLAPLEAKQFATADDKGDLAVVVKTPDGSDYRTFYGPRFADGVYTGRTGKFSDLSEAPKGSMFLADVSHAGGKFHAPTVIGLYRVEPTDHDTTFGGQQAANNSVVGTSSALQGPGQDVKVVDLKTGKQNPPPDSMLQTPQGSNVSTGTAHLSPGQVVALVQSPAMMSGVA